MENQSFAVRRSVSIVNYTVGDFIPLIQKVINKCYLRRSVGRYWNNLDIEEKIEFVEWFVPQYNQFDLCSCLGWWLESEDTNQHDLKQLLKEFARRTEENNEENGLVSEEEQEPERDMNNQPIRNDEEESENTEEESENTEEE